MSRWKNNRYFVLAKKWHHGWKLVFFWFFFFLDIVLKGSVTGTYSELFS